MSGGPPPATLVPAARAARWRERGRRGMRLPTGASRSGHAAAVASATIAAVMRHLGRTRAASARPTLATMSSEDAGARRPPAGPGRPATGWPWPPAPTRTRALQAMADALLAAPRRSSPPTPRTSRAPRPAARPPTSSTGSGSTPTGSRRWPQGLRDVAGLPDPVGEVVRGCTLANGLELRQVRVPFGVVGMIYEARPNVTADAAGICLKSGNAVLLRGSLERPRRATRRSSTALRGARRRRPACRPTSSSSCRATPTTASRR